MSDVLVVIHSGPDVLVGAVEAQGLYDAHAQSKPVILKKARSLIVRYYPVPDDAGGISIAKSANLGAPDACLVPVDIPVIMDLFYIPEAHNLVELTEMIKEAEELEVRNRANRSNLTIPGGRR